MAVEHIRVLQCLTCKTLEVVPDFEGPTEHDQFLEAAAKPHRDMGHPKAGQLYRLEKKEWDSPSTREQIIARIQEKSGHSGLDPHFYETKDNFTHDAHVCFQKHNRNPDCGDYKSDKMVLKPDTAAERKAAGLNPKARAHIYLCQFCPVHSRWRAAQYDKSGIRN